MSQILKKLWRKKGSNRQRAFLYPIGALALGVLIHLGWYHQPDPDKATYLSGADFLARNGAIDAAEEQADLALAEDPDDLHAWLIKALIAERRREHDEAIEIYERCLGLTGDEGVARDIKLSICDLHRRAEHFGKATQALLRLEDEYGRDDPALVRLRGVIASNEGLHRRALACFERYRRLEPESSEPSFLLAGELLALNDLAAARHILLEVGPDESMLWPLWPELARHHYETGDLEGAYTALARYLELDVHAAARLRKHRYWSERGQEDERLRKLMSG